MSKRKITEVENGAYFYTAHLAGESMLFSDHEYASIVLDSLKWLRESGRIRLFGYIVMPNHVHFLVQPCEGSRMAQIGSSFAKFTGRKIVEQCTAQNKSSELAGFRSAAKGAGDRQHLVWRDSLVISLDEERFIKEKLEYIHDNPKRKGWDFCEERCDFPYSSACCYDENKEPIIPIDDPFEF